MCFSHYLGVTIVYLETILDIRNQDVHKSLNLNKPSWCQVGSGSRAVERRTVNRGDNPTYHRFET